MAIPAFMQPTLPEIGDVVRNRTRDNVTGLITGTFSPTTTPTDTQVARLENTIYADMVSAVGAIPQGAADEAKATLIIGTAYLVDRNGPENSNDVADDSSSNDLRVLYKDMLKNLKTMIDRVGGTDGTEDFPEYSFESAPYTPIPFGTGSPLGPLDPRFTH